MAADGQYEPQDSRKVTGTKGDPTKSWREQEDPKDGSAQYAPDDQRNVTGQSSETEDRWQNPQKRPPRADGETPSEEEVTQRGS